MYCLCGTAGQVIDKSILGRKTRIMTELKVFSVDRDLSIGAAFETGPILAYGC